MTNEECAWPASRRTEGRARPPPFRPDVPSREIRDSRRLTGPNVLWSRPGAILDVALPPDEAEPAVAAWRRSARLLLDAVGWQGEELTVRLYPGGASLGLSAPLDALYSATAVNEAAWAAAEALLDGKTAVDVETTATSLRQTIAEESNPPLIALERAAADHGIAFLTDDDEVSVGLGTGSRTWPVSEIPEPDRVPWDELHDIPLALVTGTNGKTTTIRLLAAMVGAAELTPGVSSTDWLKVGSKTIDRGDWSGPGGGRAILRHRRVEVALLETARGGMLRRGLGVTNADVGAILNVAEDHLGEWGVENLGALVEAKFIVARAAHHLVLNADDPEIVARSHGASVPITWFGVDVDGPTLVLARQQGRHVVSVVSGVVTEYDGSAARQIIPIDEIPITLSGAARHNISNSLAAIGIARRLGLELAAIRGGLAGFRSDPDENPGRLNRFELGGARILVDFAHNPHGLQALLEMAAALPAQRRLVLIGQAGDRTDTSIRDLARIVWKARPERIIIKEMPRYLRGREAGEIPRLIAAELTLVGAPESVIGHAGSELEAVRQALEWCRPGDLLLMLSHESRDEILELLAELEAGGWRPGDELGELRVEGIPSDPG